MEKRERGEVAVSKHTCSIKVGGPQRTVSGSAEITNHQLFFYSSEGESVSIPFGLVQAIAKTETLCVSVSCKDVREIVFEFPNHGELSKFVEEMRIAVQEMALERCLAFRREASSASSRDGWLVYSPSKEYERLGLAHSEHWRVSNCNMNYRITGTYPELLGVPACVTDEELKRSAKFRSLLRLPAVCWRHANGSVIFRAGQPMIGFFGLHCSEDERIINAAVKAMGDGRKVYIFDCRTKAAALAQWALRGGGREDVNISHIKEYGITAYKLLNIANAQAQRAYYDELCVLVRPLTTRTLRNIRLMASISATAWFRQIHLIISAANEAAKVLDHGEGSCLVHCSDGWNRTTQVVALAQLILDPYYRTLEGFEVLIEKEWVSFGHQFATRLGHKKGKAHLMSPIFLQWLECVWQLQQVCPAAFEFNEQLLLAIADAALTRRYGTFLFDSPAEAAAHKCRERTASLWTDINANKDVFLYKWYRKREGMLKFVLQQKDLLLWTHFYLRHTDGDLATKDLMATLDSQGANCVQVLAAGLE